MTKRAQIANTSPDCTMASENVVVRLMQSEQVYKTVWWNDYKEGIAKCT